jgi:hypothetical protein
MFNNNRANKTERLAKITSRLKDKIAARGGSSPPIIRPPVCDYCNGVGYVRVNVDIGHPQFGQVLPCPKCTVKASGFEPDNYGLLPSDRSLTWADIIDLNGRNVYEAKRAIQAVLERGWGWVFLYGTYGTAKTTLLKVAIAEFLRTEGEQAVYTTMIDVMDEIRAAYDAKSPNQEAINRLRWWSSLPLLAIDEAEKINETEFVKERRFQLLDARYWSATQQHYGITLIAANVAPEGLPGAIASRIKDGRFIAMKLTGFDARPIAHTFTE